MQAPFHIYVGDPSTNEHPLKYQAAWLKHFREGEIPEEVMKSFGRLYSIALQHDVVFEELCVYALGAAKDGLFSPEQLKEQAAKAKEE